MATPEKIIPPIADRPFVKRYGRRTGHPMTAQAASQRWQQSKAVRAKVKGLVPERHVRPAGQQATVAGTRKRVEEVRAKLGLHR
jgi:hypothetical protein